MVVSAPGGCRDRPTTSVSSTIMGVSKRRSQRITLRALKIFDGSSSAYSAGPYRIVAYNA